MLTLYVCILSDDFCVFIVCFGKLCMHTCNQIDRRPDTGQVDRHRQRDRRRRADTHRLTDRQTDMHTKCKHQSHTHARTHTVALTHTCARTEYTHIQIHTAITICYISSTIPSILISLYIWYTLTYLLPPLMTCHVTINDSFIITWAGWLIDSHISLNH